MADMADEDVLASAGRGGLPGVDRHLEPLLHSGALTWANSSATTSSTSPRDG